jgi:hypothetical protein
MFCLKIDGATKEEWDKMEIEIRNSESLRKYFKIKE